MFILAIEQSTSACSVALTKDYDVIAEHEWEDPNVHHQFFFSVIPGLLDKASITLAEVDTFALGLGPGSFSGLRCALAALNGIALPDRKRVFGITSPEALAWQVMKETGLAPVVILGDARRGYIWYACHDCTADLPVKRNPVSLVPAEQLSSTLGNCAAIATPDWNRIGTLAKGATQPGTLLIEERRVPRARTIAELAFRKIVMNIPSEPLQPIYLHPPVAALPVAITP